MYKKRTIQVAPIASFGESIKFPVYYQRECTQINCATLLVDDSFLCVGNIESLDEETECKPFALVDIDGQEVIKSKNGFLLEYDRLNTIEGQPKHAIITLDMISTIRFEGDVISIENKYTYTADEIDIRKVGMKARVEFYKSMQSFLRSYMIDLNLDYFRKACDKIPTSQFVNSCYFYPSLGCDLFNVNDVINVESYYDGIMVILENQKPRSFLECDLIAPTEQILNYFQSVKGESKVNGF